MLMQLHANHQDDQHAYVKGTDFAAGQTPDKADDGSRFASRRPGWIVAGHRVVR